MSKDPLPYVVVVPAAGIGLRLRLSAHTAPKQYLTIAGKTVLEWAVSVFLNDSDCQRVMIALAPEDEWFSQLTLAKHPKVHTCQGGATRRDSVLNALRALSLQAVDEAAWVMVHDAARPGIEAPVIEQIKRTLQNQAVDGAIVAQPMADTIKKCGSNNQIIDTIDRTTLLAAQTPQVFRLGALLDALTRHPEVTDEASAMERDGAAIQWVVGSRRNLKLTHPADVSWLAQLLEAEHHA